MIVLLIVLILVLLLLTVAYFTFYFGMVRLHTPADPQHSSHLRPFREQILAGAQWFRDQEPETVELRARDGLKLVGWFLPAEEARGTLLLVHGYRSSPFCDFGAIFEFYHSLGWNILAVCQRAHGESEGRYITFGVKERFDVCDWALYLADRFGPEHRIVLNGVSMGSASVLMALATPLPDNVKGVIADCGFTSPYDQFAHLLQRKGIPRQPMMALVQLYARLFAGFSFRACSTVDALRQSRLPVLFVHGEQDTLVPVRFTVENYGACAGEKRLITVPEAGHATSYIFAAPRYQAALREFLDRLSPRE